MDSLRALFGRIAVVLISEGKQTDPAREPEVFSAQSREKCVKLNRLRAALLQMDALKM